MKESSTISIVSHLLTFSGSAIVGKARIASLSTFARGLQNEYAAVRAALENEWSYGQVEGQVNRLNFIKRQMYGRANFNLLRKWVICSQMLL